MVNQKDGMLNNVARYAKQASEFSGDFAELGVFRGDSAEEICKIKGDRPLHLFDTFEGLPKGSFEQIDTNTPFARQYLAPSWYSCDIDIVKKRLKYPNIFFYKGVFPKTSKPVENRQFCFVHLDADLYLSTFYGIEFFYPRLVDGGLLLIHNYDDFDGVKLAVSKFFDLSEVKRVGFKHCLIGKGENKRF